ncbi:MAG: ComEC family competence protein [Holosporaceae bacterium]|nr:ComEC family competence protein [Holosporaceae bacterium]
MNKFKVFLDDFCESEKRRAPNFIPVGIGIGITIYFSLDNEPSFWLGAAILAAALGLSLVLLRYCEKDGVRRGNPAINGRCFSDALRRFASLKLLSRVLLTIAFGFFVSQLRTQIANTFMLSEKDDEPISLVATLESCEKTEKGLKFIVDDVESRKYPDLNKLRLTWRGKKATRHKDDYVPGSRILFRAVLSPASPQAFPNAYDFKKQQYFKGISGRGFVIWKPKVLRLPKRTTRLFVERLRHYIDKKIEEYLPQETAGVAKALVTGNTAGVSKEIRQNFANSGIAHLLAISGLHMGIIGFFIFWLSRILLCCVPRISMFYDVKKIAAVVSWIAVLCYLHISGKSVPSVRAFIMHTILMLAILIDKGALTMRSVALAATTIMTCSPEVIMFPSFQMSFGAVIAIVALYERTWNFSGFFKTLFDVVATTAVASATTTIFSVSAFNQLTLNSVPANVISIPLTSFLVMPAAAVALFLIPFGFSQPFIVLMGFGVKALMKIAELSAQLPGSYFVMRAPTSTNMAIFIFSGLTLTLIQHRVRFLGIVGIIAGLFYYYFNPTPDIFISPYAKTIGIKTPEAACFSHLGHFRSTTAAWARSIGFEKGKRFNSRICKKYISKIDDNTYEARIKGRKVTLTDDENALDAVFLDENCDFAKTIYIPSRECVSTAAKKRPWS